MKTLLGNKLSALPLSPGFCCFLGPSTSSRCPLFGPRSPGRGDQGDSCWVIGWRTPVWGGSGGVRLKEGQRAGAWRGSSQSAANGFQGPVKWKSLQERGRERPLSLERGCGAGVGVSWQGEAELHALCVMGCGGGWMGAAEPGWGLGMDVWLGVDSGHSSSFRIQGPQDSVLVLRVCVNSGLIRGKIDLCLLVPLSICPRQWQSELGSRGT